MTEETKDSQAAAEEQEVLNNADAAETLDEEAPSAETEAKPKASDAENTEENREESDMLDKTNPEAAGEGENEEAQPETSEDEQAEEGENLPPMPTDDQVQRWIDERKIVIGSDPFETIFYEQNPVRGVRGLRGLETPDGVIIENYTGQMVFAQGMRLRKATQPDGRKHSFLVKR